MNQIPKIIHYCWFGGNPKPELVQKCIKSWIKYCPDYEIVEWNEDNFDIHSHVFVEEAYLAKKWAFVSDYVRAYALLTAGGIYLDTDLELHQPLDVFLDNPGFVGFEVNDLVATGIIGCTKDSPIIKKYFEFFQDKHFKENGPQKIQPSPMILTPILCEKGLKMNGKKQAIEDCVVYPKNCFYPTGLNWVFDHYTSQTFAVHHYMDSWGRNPKSGRRSIRSRIRVCLVHWGRNLFGTSTMYEMGRRIHKVLSKAPG